MGSLKHARAKGAPERVHVSLRGSSKEREQKGSGEVGSVQRPREARRARHTIGPLATYPHAVRDTRRACVCVSVFLSQGARSPSFLIQLRVRNGAVHWFPVRRRRLNSKPRPQLFRNRSFSHPTTEPLNFCHRIFTHAGGGEGDKKRLKAAQAGERTYERASVGFHSPFSPGLRDLASG